MKLAEALVHRADYQRKIQQLKNRLERVIKVQEGEEPAENPTLLVAELDRTVNELTLMIQKINKTNALTPFDAQFSIADALAERDKFMQKRNLLNEMIEHASIKQDRYSRSEVKFFRTVDIIDLQQQVDTLSKSYRELDFKIQEKNWTIDLLD
ncbi:DIP1984 family protein [Paenibacillus sp. 481]|uniref:DIP1984 family protein n=1 Tax=Paenibacillus sp. 481 TaxID=2835869 RepID=UPI001E31AB1A|nr:DIP1984 family protein [Paenibacillus sp. 481]UHA73697.1 DIP1984 family protein [Paenibacillus sp. 481]